MRARLAEAPPKVAVLGTRTRLRFLLIEDCASDSELVRTLLEGEFPNGEVQAVTSVQGALALLATSSFDLVLADLTHPGADGGAVVGAVRSASPRTPLMVITGRTDGSLALWALGEGAQDYLVEGEHDGPRFADALVRGVMRSRAEQVTHGALVTALHRESQSAIRLRELDAAKGDFVQTVSHELRTPLSSIAGYAELLQSEPGLSARQAGFVDAIVRNANRLTALTEDLLLLSEFKAARAPQEALEVDLGAVVAHAGEVLVALGSGRGREVSFDLPDCPALVTGHAVHLERVVLNLVGNAIKFSEDGGTVNCRVWSGSTHVFLAVADTGIGIPEDEQRQMFNRFFRGASARSRAIQGTGLGLDIVASIVTDHGGEVTVASKDGQGAIFTVRLPRLIPTPLAS